MLAVASLKRSLEFDPVEQGVKRKRAEMKLSPPSSPSSSSSTTATFPMNTNPLSPSKQQQQQQQQQQQSIFTSSPNKNQSLVFKKPCSLTALTSSSSPTTDDIPMLTYTQTAQMCARLLREQDRSIREQYTHDSVHKDQSKRQQHRLFHFGQQQEKNNTSTVAFSYVS
ncbi:unnamed protein product [Rotaria magnacalcarata]